MNKPTESQNRPKGELNKVEVTGEKLTLFCLIWYGTFIDEMEA